MTFVARKDLHGGPCPRCGRELLVLELANLGVEGCDRCGGLWLDGDSADRVLESIHAGALTAAAAASACATESVDTSATCKCPRCRRPMRTVMIEGPDVELDRCDAHGTWFDRDELQRVSRAAAAARRRAGVGEASTVAGPGGRDAGQGAASFGVAVLGEVAAEGAGTALEVAAVATTETAGAVLDVALEALASIFEAL